MKRIMSGALKSVSVVFSINFRRCLPVLILLCLIAPASYAQDDTPWSVVSQIGYGSLRDVAWSSDGSMFAIASDTAVRLYDPTMQEIGIIDVPRVSEIAWQPGGTRLAMATVQGIAIWDVPQAAAPVPVREIPPGLAPMAWSPHGAWLAFADSEAQIWLHDAQTGSARVAFRGHMIEGEDGWHSFITALVWSPDGSQIASSSNATPLYGWNVALGEITFTASPDNTSYINLILWRADNRLHVFDDLYFGANEFFVSTEDGTVVNGDTPWTDGMNSPAAVAYSPDGTRVAFWTIEHTLNVMDSTTLERIAEFRTVPVGDDTNETYEVEHNGKIAWSPDGQAIVTGTLAHAYLWKIDDATITLVDTIDDKYMGWLNRIAWSPDGTQLASGHGLEDMTRGDANRMRVWDVAAGALDWQTVGSMQPTISLDWSDDGQKILAGYALDLYFFRIWDTTTQAVIATSPDCCAYSDYVNWLPDSERFVVPYGGSQIMLFDLADQANWDMDSSVIGYGYVLDVSDDGLQIVISNGAGFDITVMNLADESLISTLEQTVSYDRGAATLAFSPNGKQVAVSSGSNTGDQSADAGISTISIYDAATGKRLHLMKGGHTSGIMELGWSPDGRYVVSAGRDGSARLWDVTTGKEVALLVQVDGSIMSSAAFSPDGKTIAVSTWNGMIYLLRQA